LNRLKPVFSWALIATVYYLAASLGLSLAFEQANTSPVWPPTGIAIAAILFLGLRAWPGIFAGALVANLSTGLALLPSLGIATGNTLEALAAGFVLLTFANSYPFRKVRHVAMFTATILAATPISATVGVGSLLTAGVIDQQAFALLWGTWWLGDAVGGLILTPFLLTWAQPPDFSQYARQKLERLALIACTLLCISLVFGKWFDISDDNYALSFVFIPLLVWTAFRFRQHAATLFIVVLTGIAIYATLQGLGPFVSKSANTSLLLLQAFMGVITVTTLLMAAAVNERNLSFARLTRSRNKLEEHIEQRTRDLRESNAALESEIEVRTHTEHALRALLATSAAHTSEAFFRNCVEDLANVYGTEFALVGIYADETMTSIRTLAVWAGGDFAENFIYDLQGTPCQDVLNRDIELIPCDARQQYPQDELLVQMGIDSYFGAPLVSPSDRKIGLVAVMGTKPLSLQHWIKPVLGIFANRLALEIERKSAEDELKLAASVFNENVEAIMITDRDTNILRVNPAFCRITGYSANEIIGQPTSVLNSGRQDHTFYADFWQSLMDDNVWQGEIWNRRKDGAVIPVWQTISVVRDACGEIDHFISIFSDISEKKMSEERIYHLAHYDILTGLPNRSSFQNDIEEALVRAIRRGHQVALLFLDLDQFKLINDAAGHTAGDELLKQVALRLKRTVRDEDVVARLGGDEFTVLLDDIHSAENADLVAEKILHQLASPFQLDHSELVVTTSIGISVFPDDCDDAATLLKNADTAMYRAKEQGRNNCQFFTEEMKTRASERLRLENEMRSALKRNEFLLHYQPQVDTQSGKIVGLEALVRWQHPERGMVPPGVFIPVAEDSGLIVPLGKWIMQEACAQYKAWLDAGLQPVRIAVNLSGRQFVRQDLHGMVEKILDEAGIPPQCIELELTESTIMENVDETIEVLKALRELGVHLSIDDFGTGYSSMAYLKRFTIDKLKIDQSFVRDIATDSDDAAIVTATIAMAHALNLTVIAEGVETEQQLEFLKDNGCEQMQGYYFSRPLPAREITGLLRSGRCPGVKQAEEVTPDAVDLSLTESSVS
jgi:diguanylate cyclase (GGDEF)-like protein/PAS domain S-box-containing protein